MVDVRGTVSAGPTCPVETEPPQSGCGDRPVGGAVIRVIDPGGHEVASVTSDEVGEFQFSLPPGRYTLMPEPVEGLMGTAAEQELTVAADGAPDVQISYDMGIR